MRRWFRPRLWMWMALVAAVAVLLAHHRIEADRRAAAAAEARLVIIRCEAGLRTPPAVAGHPAVRPGAVPPGPGPARPGAEEVDHVAQ